RIPFSSAFRQTAYDVNVAGGELADAQRIVASGRRIDRPSDDPAGASSAVTDHASLGTLDGYTQTTNSATSRLAVTDTSLTDVTNQISAAQTAVASAKGSTATQAQRDAAAMQLQGISDSLVADFNAKFRGTYVFAGTKSTTQPYTQNGGIVSAYQ